MEYEPGLALFWQDLVLKQFKMNTTLKSNVCHPIRGRKGSPAGRKHILVWLKIVQPHLPALLSTERTSLAYTYFLIFFHLIFLAFFLSSHLLSFLSPWNWFLLVCLGSNKISERITFQWHTFNRRQMICPNLIIKYLHCIVKGKQPL